MYRRYYEEVVRYLVTGDFWPGASDLQKKVIQKRANKYKVLNGVLYHKGKGRDVNDLRLVPTTTADQLNAIRVSHENSLGAHFGLNKTASLLTEKFYWRMMYTDVLNFCQKCPLCTASNEPLIVTENVNTDDQNAWKLVEVELIENFHSTRKSVYHVLRIVDVFSNWTTFVPLSDLQEKTLVRLLVQEFAPLGFPLSIRFIKFRSPANILKHLHDELVTFSMVHGLSPQDSYSVHVTMEEEGPNGTTADSYLSRYQEVIEKHFASLYVFFGHNCVANQVICSWSLDKLHTFCSEYPYTWTTKLQYILFSIQNSVPPLMDKSPFQLLMQGRSAGLFNCNATTLTAEEILERNKNLLSESIISVNTPDRKVIDNKKKRMVKNNQVLRESSDKEKKNSPKGVNKEPAKLQVEPSLNKEENRILEQLFPADKHDHPTTVKRPVVTKDPKIIKEKIKRAKKEIKKAVKPLFSPPPMVSTPLKQVILSSESSPSPGRYSFRQNLKAKGPSSFVHRFIAISTSKRGNSALPVLPDCLLPKLPKMSSVPLSDAPLSQSLEALNSALYGPPVVPATSPFSSPNQTTSSAALLRKALSELSSKPPLSSPPPSTEFEDEIDSLPELQDPLGTNPLYIDDACEEVITTNVSDETGTDVLMKSSEDTTMEAKSVDGELSNFEEAAIFEALKNSGSHFDIETEEIPNTEIFEDNSNKILNDTEIIGNSETLMVAGQNVSQIISKLESSPSSFASDSMDSSLSTVQPITDSVVPLDHIIMSHEEVAATITIPNSDCPADVMQNDNELQNSDILTKDTNDGLPLKQQKIDKPNIDVQDTGHNIEPIPDVPLKVTSESPVPVQGSNQPPKPVNSVEVLTENNTKRVYSCNEDNKSAKDSEFICQYVTEISPNAVIPSENSFKKVDLNGKILFSELDTSKEPNHIGRKDVPKVQKVNLQFKMNDVKGKTKELDKFLASKSNQGPNVTLRTMKVVSASKDKKNISSNTTDSSAIFKSGPTAPSKLAITPSEAFQAPVKISPSKSTTEDHAKVGQEKVSTLQGPNSSPLPKFVIKSAVKGSSCVRKMAESREPQKMFSPDRHSKPGTKSLAGKDLAGSIKPLSPPKDLLSPDQVSLTQSNLLNKSTGSKVSPLDNDSVPLSKLFSKPVSDSSPKDDDLVPLSQLVQKVRVHPEVSVPVQKELDPVYKSARIAARKNLMKEQKESVSEISTKSIKGPKKLSIEKVEIIRDSAGSLTSKPQTELNVKSSISEKPVSDSVKPVQRKVTVQLISDKITIKPQIVVAKRRDSMEKSTKEKPVKIDVSQIKDISSQRDEMSKKEELKKEIILLKDTSQTISKGAKSNKSAEGVVLVKEELKKETNLLKNASQSFTKEPKPNKSIETNKYPRESTLQTKEVNPSLKCVDMSDITATVSDSLASVEIGEIVDGFLNKINSEESPAGFLIGSGSQIFEIINPTEITDSLETVSRTNKDYMQEFGLREVKVKLDVLPIDLVRQGMQKSVYIRRILRNNTQIFYFQNVKIMDAVENSNISAVDLLPTPSIKQTVSELGYHKRPVKCPVCPKTYLSSEHMLEVHLKFHCASDVRNLLCPVCGKPGNNWRAVWKHYTTHQEGLHYLPEEERAQCPICGKLFKSKESVGIHIRRKHNSHSNSITPQNSYKCPNCEYSTAAHYNFIMHTTLMECQNVEEKLESEYEEPLLSTGIRPEDLFLESALENERKAATDKFQCEYCPLRFPSLNSLNSHMSKHTTNLASFTCKICNYRCKYKTVMLKHARKNHQGISLKQVIQHPKKDQEYRKRIIQDDVISERATRTKSSKEKAKQADDDRMDVSIKDEYDDGEERLREEEEDGIPTATVVVHTDENGEIMVCDDESELEVLVDSNSILVDGNSVLVDGSSVLVNSGALDPNGALQLDPSGTLQLNSDNQQLAALLSNNQELLFLSVDGQEIQVIGENS